ncbi:MAG: DUF2817 domain-containing protein [Planctomycetes bacterium]|nr:DUF2817 domain-containing protein [Planctomycetota bacterium]
MTTMRIARLLGILVIAAGCSWPVSTGAGEATPAVPHDFRLVGWSVEARPIFAHIHGAGEETVLLVAGLHGDAPTGTQLVRQFMTQLAAEPGLLTGRRVVTLPLLNPDGRARGTRHNARDVDLERNFPTRNWRISAHGGSQPASEPETAALVLAVERYRPARVLQLRSPLFCVTSFADAGQLARRMAEACGHPLVTPRLPHPTGALASYLATDRRIPTVVLDLRRRDAYPELWAEVHPALEVFVRGE